MPCAGGGEIGKRPRSTCLGREFLRLTRASPGRLPTLGELKVGGPQKHSGLFLLSLHNTELLTAIIYEISQPCGLAGLSCVALPLLGGWLGLLTWLHSAGAWLGQPSPGGLTPVAGGGASCGCLGLTLSRCLSPSTDKAELRYVGARRVARTLKA